MPLDTAFTGQQQRNTELLNESRYLKGCAESKVLPLTLDLANQATLSKADVLGLQALEIEAARTAISSLASLAKIGELDHLGGGLDLISALTMTQACTDFEKVHYTIENAHCSIGYYGVLAAFGFLDKSDVVDSFRRGIDIPGHVSWVPGGTQLNGGRLGVMIPAAVGQALGVKAIHGKGSWVVCHTGDAGWISGQALNGFNGADLHGAPVTFVMHRNGIQLSGSNAQIMDKDPRSIIEAMGVTILEIPTLHCVETLYGAYREAQSLADEGRPTLIYPTGYRSEGGAVVNLTTLGNDYGILAETTEFAAANGVAMDTEVWIPGSMMSYRDVVPMLECIFLVNDLPGGHGHHDGSMKGRSEEAVLGNPMMTASAEQTAAMAALSSAAPRVVKTPARPAAGSANLVLDAAALSEVKLPDPGKDVSARAGVEAGYAAVAKANPDSVFVVSCDLDPSTKLGKAKTFLKDDHCFEMSIEEQVSAIMANGLAVATYDPQLVVFSTFSAFFEGIAREGMEMWRYQRNLNGVNEGLNVTMHLSHVGACTGRDHFSGWSLDWITLALGYLPYLHRFYAPADARAAFLAVKDLAANYGGHIIGIPRDNLPILTKQDGTTPLFDVADAWEPVTSYRTTAGAKRAILAMGAPACLAEGACEALNAAGVATDAYVVNGLPGTDELAAIIARYPDGVVTIEDGIIGCECSGLRGFASVVAMLALKAGVKADFVGITDPRTAPADGHYEVWEHFGLTTDALVAAVKGL